MNIEISEKSIPATWDVKPLSELCESGKDSIVDGPFGSNLKRSDFLESGVPVLKLQNIKPNQIIQKNMDFVSQEKFEQLHRHSFRTGDIVMTKLGDPLGVSAIVSDIKDGVIVADLVRIRPKSVNSKFLCYQLNSPLIGKHLNDNQKGTTRPRINLSIVRDLTLNVPPLDEQQKIVEILEEQLSRLDAALASVRAVREKSERFRRSLLHAAFTGTLTGHDTEAGTLPIGWSTVRLGDCLEKLKSGKLVERGWSPQCLSQPSPDEDTWGVLKTTAVQMGDYWPDFNKELPKALEPKIGLEVNDGDFLMTTTGPRNRCGIVCFVNQTRKKLIFSGKILRFRADASKLIPGWLMYSMMSPEIQKAFDEMKVGTSDSSVSIGNQQVLDLIIPVAPLDEQKKTLELLEAQFSRLDASLAIADAIERKASALRRSLLHAAFSGNLTKEWREGADV